MLDFLVVGSGLTGATVARLLHDAGKRVQVLEQRDHVGGNVHDHIQHGVRVHTYGPHYFRTNNERIWGFVNRFATWWTYEPCLLTEVDGELFPWPPTQQVVDRFAGPLHTGPVRNFEEASLAMMPEGVYRRFVEPYTRKQWGVDPSTLAPELAGRFDVRTTDLRLKPHRHQGIPTHGYTNLMQSMLDGIPVALGTPWDHQPTRAHVVYTGPIDAYHQHRLGTLRYRSQHREHHYHPDRVSVQPCGQVNNPGPGQHIRTLEWRHMAPPTCTPGTVTTTETPHDGGYEYPFPDQANAALYQQYRQLPTPGVTICGRLGEYRYYDMDQAIGRAHRIAARLLRSTGPAIGTGGTGLPQPDRRGEGTWHPKGSTADPTDAYANGSSTTTTPAAPVVDQSTRPSQGPTEWGHPSTTPSPGPGAAPTPRTTLD